MKYEAATLHYGALQFLYKFKKNNGEFIRKTGYELTNIVKTMSIGGFGNNLLEIYSISDFLI